MRVPTAPQQRPGSRNSIAGATPEWAQVEAIIVEEDQLEMHGSLANESEK